MSIIIIAVIILVAVLLLCWGVDQVPQLAPFAGLAKLLIIVIGVLFLLSRSGIA